MSTSPRRGPILALVTALIGLLVLGAVPVLAHAELESSDPADGAQLAAPPTTITLTFSEGVNAKRSQFLLNQGGTTLGTGRAAADGDTRMTLDGLSLDPGAYVIRWTSVAEDGDLLRGTIRFTVLEPTPAPATPTPTATPIRTDDNSQAPPTGSPSPVALTPSPQASADTAPASSTGSDVLLPIVLALLVVAGAGAYLFTRSRRA